ncbi:unnamed protein product, partial [Meganyctiphanes norvegica]
EEHRINEEKEFLYGTYNDSLEEEYIIMDKINDEEGKKATLKPKEESKSAYNYHKKYYIDHNKKANQNIYEMSKESKDLLDIKGNSSVQNHKYSVDNYKNNISHVDFTNKPKQNLIIDYARNEIDRKMEEDSDDSYNWMWKDECPELFLSIGNGCYYFSVLTYDWSTRQKMCQSLGKYYGIDVSLAMLDIFDQDKNLNNQQLLSRVTEKGFKFWLGGRSSHSEWYWLDGRTIDKASLYWYFREPSSVDGCVSAQVSTSSKFNRTYLHSNICSQKINAICQAPRISCPPDFRPVGGNCFYFSNELGLNRLTWKEARRHCQQLKMPKGTVADMAVMELNSNYDDLLVEVFRGTG